MTRLAHDLIQAPQGMDNTADPSVLSELTAQQITNLWTDRPGLLRGQAQLQAIALSAFANPLDGVGYLPSQQVTYSNGTTSTTPAPALLAVTCNGTLYAYPQVVPATYPPTYNVGGVLTFGSLIAGKRVRFCGFGQELYGAQEQNAYANYRTQYNGTTTVMGQYQPPAVTFTYQAPTGGHSAKTGKVQYVQCWVDNLGRLSSPSPPVTADFTTHPGNDVLLDTTALFLTDPQAVKAQLFATLGNGTVFYWIATLNSPNRTFEDGFTDAQVGTGTPAPAFGANDMPLPGSILAVHKNRMVMNVTADPTQIQISNNGSATQFNSTGVRVDANANIVNPTEGIRLSVGTDQGDQVTGLASLGSVLGVWKRHGLYLLYGDDLTDFLLRKISDRGCVAVDSVVHCDNVVAFLSNDGVYVIDGSYAIEKISKPIESTFAALFNTIGGQATMEKAQAWYYQRRYHLQLGAQLYVYDFDAKGWTQASLGATVAAACTATPAGSPALVFLARSDSFAVSLLDEVTLSVAVSGMVYRTRPIVTNLPWHLRASIGEQQHRVAVKRLRRVKVFGSGTGVTGTITATMDGRTESYAIGGADANAQILLQQAFTPKAYGRIVDITLNLSGTGVVISDIEVDYIFVG